MSTPWILAMLLLGLYGVFHLWYGGTGKPLTAPEIDDYMAQLKDEVHEELGHGGPSLKDQVRTLLERDDGREFVMHNLVRYRSKALYPPGSPYSDDPRAADLRYFKGGLPSMLRLGIHPVFVARRQGSFVDLPGAPEWHYMAMVRYRSRRDFVRWAIGMQKAQLTQHKWAAIETTQIFPSQPVISLVWVRSSVAVCLLVLGGLLTLVVR